MATIRKITPSQGISDFRQMRQEGGGGFRALAQAMDVAYDYLMPAAIDEATKKGDALGREIAKGQIGDPQAAVVQSTMNRPAEHDHASHRGISHEDWLRYSNQGATRNDPLNPKLVDAMSFVKDMGITMDVISGGQEAAGTPGARRTGSTRHDHGNSADVDFYRDGRKLDWNNPADLPVLQDIVRGAKSRGVTGIGAGDDYMGPGRFHVGFGAPAVWGAGGQGANAPAWLREAYDGVPQGTYAGSVTASTSGTEAPTVMRGADGKLTSRLFGPTANPIMAAHDAAAGVAYQSDVFLKAGQDFMGMSEQFAMNPEGFKQAADEYVKAMVESAPEPFRMDIRAKLENEASRRFLGLVDEKHANIRQRAANSSAALAEKWSDDLASAMASGNPEEIEAARTELGSVLAARERLPGSTWTPEQSANYMRKAEEAGQAAIQKAQDEQASAWKTALNTVIDTAKLGRRAVDEAILTNPAVQQMFPELAREAMAFTTLRDELPSFNMMTPAEQQAALAEMKDQPVTEEWENDLYGAAEKAAGANAAAWKSDPIKRAGEVLTNNPPPVLPELDPMNPEVFASALAARAEYGVALMDQGYTDRAVFVSKEEAKTIGAMFGKEVPPELKAMAAGMVVQAMGPNAAGFFKQINTSDPVIPHVGSLMAMGGDPAVATEAMLGQSLLDQKVAQAPSASAVAKGMVGVQEALAATPGAAGALDSVRKTATAIYAARIPAGADETTQAQVMQEAWQAALGQSNSLGRTTGGVQDVGGHQVLLPPQMAGEDLDKAMSRAFGDTGGFWSWAPAVAGNPDMWVKAAGGIPALGGEPIGADLWLNGEITMTPVGGTKYMLSVTRNGVVIDIGVQGQPDDVPFIFDAEALIEASLVP
jgi:hypothetical protein